MRSICIMACALTAFGLSNPAFAQKVEIDKRLEELVVVASRLPTEVFKTGHAVSVLDHREIKDLGHPYGADLLRTLPGVAVNRAGGYGGLTQVRLRGADGNHLVVLVDGVDVSAAGTGEYDFASLLAADIGRIELLRGPQSGLYGSNALAGVMNISTLGASAAPGVEVLLEGGQNGARQAMLSATGGNERIRGRVSLLRRETAFDVSTDDSLGDESDEDRNQTLSGTLSFTASDALSFELVGRLTDRETQTDGFDFTGGPQQGLAVDDSSFSNTSDLTLAGRAFLNLAQGRSQTRLGIETTRTDLDGGAFGSKASRDNVNLDTSYRWDSALIQRSTLFVQLEREDFSNLYPYDPSQEATQARSLIGFGLEHRIDVNDQLFLGATARRDRNDEFESATTWSLDASWVVANVGSRLHASVGTGITNPTFFEQFGFVPGSFVGNAALKPEASLGWDLGLEQQLADGDVTLDVTYFAADLENEIISLFPSVANAASKSERRGVELSLTSQPWPNTSISASYTYTDAHEPEGRELRRPRHTGSIGLAQSLMDGRARLSGQVVYNGDQLDSDFRHYFTNGFVAERTALAGYTLANVNASLDITDSIRLFVRVENLFDEHYEEVIGYATPGRAAYAGVRVSFGRPSR